MSQTQTSDTWSRVPRRKSDGTRPTVVELFAGAGGMMLGLEMAGFHTLVANEVHHDPCKTLRRNFPGVPIIEGSIRDISIASLLREAAGSLPHVDLVAGGPPCQGFSTAGLKDKVDPRNTLIGDYIRTVQELRPQFFLLENVTGLMTLHDGKLFANVLEQLHDLGYEFEHRVLFAADYGVPQMRKRLIVLGSRDGNPPAFPEPSHRHPQVQNLFDGQLPGYITCGDALSDLPLIGHGETTTEYEDEPKTDYQHVMREGSTQLYNHEATRHRAETMEYYALIPPGGTVLDIPVENRKGKQGIQRWPLDRIARTVTCEPTDFLHPTLDRIPTIRELARIQTFPDRFEFLGQRTAGNFRRRQGGYCAQSQQVGNAVPPVLARAVGSAIMQSVLADGELETAAVAESR
jgi:DNA (cytosine-5)-methyltransferase 1